MKKIAILLAIIPLVSGCASYIQAVDGYATAAATSARAASDLNLKRLQFELCATPFSALVRNPEFFGAVRELCVGSGTTVEELLQSAEVKK